MIVDSLENACLYSGLSSLMQAAFAWLQTSALSSLPTGEHTLADGIRAIVQTYETVPEAGRRYEAHRRNIDIQYLISGTERVLVAPVVSLSANGDYDAASDIIFFRGGRRRSDVVLTPGMFAVFHPDDGHMPMLWADSAAEVKKVVVKVPV